MKTKTVRIAPLLFLLANFSLFIQADMVKIVKILNNSPKPVYFAGLSIKPDAVKKCLQTIPFVARQKNFVDFIQDRAYVPADALELITHDGTFYIWRDERGVIVAKKFELGMARSEALPQVLLNLSVQELSRVVGCMVTINQSGTLEIKKS